MTHYEILGVPRDVDAATLKRRYRQLAKEHHTDREGGDDETMAEINVAYEVLSDPVRRARYDETGDDKAANIKSKGLQLLCGKILEWLHSAMMGDMMTQVISRLEQERHGARMKYAEGEQLIAKYEKALKRVKYKGSGTDLMHLILTSRIEEVSRMMRQVRENQEILDAAVEMSSDYEYEIDLEEALLHRPPMLGGPQVFFNAAWNR